MSLALAPAGIAESMQQKRAGLLWCTAAGIGCVGVLKVLRWLWDRFGFALDAPAGIPQGWWVVDQRATSFAIRELFALALFAAFVRLRGLRLADLGFRQGGTRASWVAAFVVLAVGLASHPFVRSGPYPLTGYTLYAALVIGIPVALLEECVYRGFAIKTLQAAGFGLPMQIIFTGFLFGAVHVSYVGVDWTVPVFTGVLGCIWSWIFIRGGNSLWPTLIAHAINDAVVMPYFYVHGVY